MEEIHREIITLYTICEFTMHSDESMVPDHLRPLLDRWRSLVPVATETVPLISEAIRTHEGFTLISTSNTAIKFSYLGGSYELVWLWSRIRHEGRIHCVRIDQSASATPSRITIAAYYFDRLGNIGREYQTPEAAKLLIAIKRDILSWMAVQANLDEFSPF